MHFHRITRLFVVPSSPVSCSFILNYVSIAHQTTRIIVTISVDYFLVGLCDKLNKLFLFHERFCPPGMNAAELYRIRTDAGTARAFVNQHVGRGTTAADGMYDGQMLDSLAGGRPLRIQCVQADCAVEGRALNSYVPVGYNGAVHAVDNVLCPTAVSVDDLIRRNDSFRCNNKTTKSSSPVVPSTSPYPIFRFRN